MKKRVLALFLAFCLAFTLLSTGATALNDGLNIEVASEAELQAALNKTEKVSSIVVTGSFTVNSDCTIHFEGDKINYYYETEMRIPGNVTLTVGDGGSIGCAWYTFEGEWDDELTPGAKLITCYGEGNTAIIIENGGAVSGDFTRNDGTLTVKAGGVLTLPGEMGEQSVINVETGGTAHTTQGGRAVNNGEISIETGASLAAFMGTTIVNRGTLNLSGDMLIGGYVDDEGRETTWFENNGTVNSDGGKVFADYNVSAETRALLESTFRVPVIYTGAPVYTEQELLDALNGEGAILSRANNLCIMNDITVTQNTGTMEKNIFVPDGVTLTMADGAYFDAPIFIEAGGKIDVLSGGTLSTTMGGSIENRGTVDIAQGGVFISRMGGTIINKNGGVINADGTLNISDPEDWGMMGRFSDEGGDITGSGRVNISNSELAVKAERVEPNTVLKG